MFETKYGKYLTVGEWEKLRDILLHLEKVDGKCPICHKTVKEIMEEGYRC